MHRVILATALGLAALPLRAESIALPDMAECPSAIYSEVVTEGRFGFSCLHAEIAPGQVVEAPEAFRSDRTDSFGEGGLFEVAITNSTWPETAELCPIVVLRMPWSDPDTQEGAIAAKREIFDALSAGPEMAMAVHLAIPLSSALHPDAADRAAMDPSAPGTCMGFFVGDATTGAYLE